MRAAEESGQYTTSPMSTTSKLRLPPEIVAELRREALEEMKELVKQLIDSGGIGRS